MATTGQKIKTFRSLKSITQQQLADKAGLDRSTVARIETDKLKPNGEILKTLASLGMNIEELLSSTDGSTKEKALQMRVAELELKLMNMESQLNSLIKLVEEKL